MFSSLSFQDYCERHLPEITSVQNMLITKLSDTPTYLEQQIKEIEAQYSRFTTVLAYAESYLDLAEKQHLEPKTKEKTDTDRQVELAAACVLERRFRDIVKGLVESIDKRIMLGMALMKRHNVEVREARR